MIEMDALANRKLKRKTIILAFFLLAQSSLILFALSQDKTPNNIISVEKNTGLEERLRKMGLDLLFEWEGRIFILVRDPDLLVLDRLNIPYAYETHRFPPPHQDRFQAQTGLNGAYHSYKELETDLQALERFYPELARIFIIGTTLENRKIYALKISANVSQDENEPEVLFLGCHHAREWISVEIPFLLAKYLLESYAVNAEVKRMVNQSEVWIVPMVNPDGLEYSIHYYRYWRKNRRLNADGSYGVDINRNYGYAWGYDNDGSSPEPASDVYRGSAPFSEPETQAVRDFVQQKHFRAMITYHSYSQVILYPWGYTKTPPANEPLLNGIAAGMSHLMSPVNGRTYAYGEAGASLYLTNGDATDWIFSASAIPAYTIELPPIDQLQGGFFNAETDIGPIFSENLPAALYLIDWSIQNFWSALRRPQERDRKVTATDKTKNAKRPFHSQNR
jgi:carboxypeptidase T